MDHSWADMVDASERDKEEHQQAKEALLRAHEKFRDGQKAAAKVVS